MGFSSGRVSFCRFVVAGAKAPKQVSQDLLDQLAKNAFADTPIGAPAPGSIESGWTAGEHLFDQQFTFEKNVFGSMLFFALRLDTHKVPSDLKNAYHKIHEQALAAQNPSGFATRDQKRQAKDEADAQVHNDLAQGKFRRSKHVELLWDLADGSLYCSATGTRVIEQLAARFRASFDLSLEYQSAGRLAADIMQQNKRLRDFEDLRPSPFTSAPDAAHPEADSADRGPIDTSIPSVPWTASGTDLKDFLGNEFLLWLWHHTLHHEGEVQIATEHGKRPVAVMLDRSLDMDCAWGVTGKQSLRGSGPTQMKEAREALRQGKWPRKAGMIVSDGDSQWELILQTDHWQVGSALLPEIEKADTPRQLIEQRFDHLRLLARTLDGLYQTFLQGRTGSAWPISREAIRDWIASRKR